MIEMGRGGQNIVPEVVRVGKGYEWTQNTEEVEVRFDVGDGVGGKDVKVVFKARHLKVAVKGEVKGDGELGGGVIVDECTWCIEGGALVVTLGKREGQTMWEEAIKE